MEHLLKILNSILEPTVVVVIVILVLLLNRWIFNRMKSVGSAVTTIRRSIVFLISFIGTIIFILAFPIEAQIKG